MADQRRTHFCTVCGFEGFWTNRWRWYGSILDEENGTLAKLCSDDCRQKFDTRTMAPKKRGPEHTRERR